MRKKDRKSIAYILSVILIFLGICTMYTSAYSSFVSVKYQKGQTGAEVYRESVAVSSYEKVCTTGMIYGSRNSMVTGVRFLFRNHIPAFGVRIMDNKLPVNQLSYFMTVSLIFSPLFDYTQGLVNYMHNQDGEK